MTPISVQLYTLREECAKDFFGVLRTLADIGFAGVETAGLHGKSASEVASVFSDLGLKASSGHVALPTPENIDELAETASTLGYSLLVGGCGPNEFATLDEIKRTSEKFQAAALLAKERGLQFGIHNHWWEFDAVDGRLPYDLMLEYAPDAFSELDVYWTKVGGQDPAVVVAKNKSRLPLLHIKDGPAVKDEPMTAVGAGTLDIPAIVKAVDPDVLRWLVVELDACATDMTEAVRQSFAYMTENGLGKGK